MHLGDGLALPLDAVTQTFGILAVRGAGKSNAAAVMAEEMFNANLPFVVVDPVGVWWGLRSSGDGKGPGLAIPIFGGRHGDVPLEKAGGPLVADLIVGERLSAVLDVSEFSEGDKIRLLIDFAERLYRTNQDPLHLFLEEADDYAPQRPFRDQARLLRAWENIVRRGRARGLGITMITQRSAALNKNVLTQIETLLVLRTTSPQDRKAIEGWVEYHGQKRELIESLAGLEAGEAWVWSPSWLRAMKRVQIRRRWTFDSAATPKDVHGSRRPTTLADVDLGAITKRMAATIERAKADDPRELRRRVQQLERELAAAKTAQPAPTVQRVEVPVLKHVQMRALESLPAKLEKPALRLAEVTAVLGASLRELREALAQLNAPAVAAPLVASAGVARQASVIRAIPRRPAAMDPPPSGNRPRLGRSGARRMLIALAQHPGAITDSKVALLSGIARRGGTFRTYLGQLRTAGYVAGDRHALAITPSGLEALGTYGPLPTPGPELVDYWLTELGNSGMRRLLEGLIDVYPRALSREGLAERSGMALDGGTFRTYLGKLRTLELVAGRGDELRASEDLFR